MLKILKKTNIFQNNGIVHAERMSTELARPFYSAKELGTALVSALYSDVQSVSQ